MSDRERITATGFEASLIKTWGGWDQMDTTAFMFYDSEVTEVFDIPTDVRYDVYIDMEKMIVEVQSKETVEIITTRNIALALV